MGASEIAADHPKYGHLPRCPKDPNKLCDYNTLKEKAEQWDYLFRDTPDILQNAAKYYDKLGAIKEVIEKIYNSDTPINGYIPNKGTQEIKAILEGEG